MTKRLKRIWVGVGAAGLLVCCAVGLVVFAIVLCPRPLSSITEELFYGWLLGAPTKYGPGYSEAAFFDIRQGKTPEEVIQTLGQPLATYKASTFTERHTYAKWGLTAYITRDVLGGGYVSSLLWHGENVARDPGGTPRLAWLQERYGPPDQVTKLYLGSMTYTEPRDGLGTSNYLVRDVVLNEETGLVEYLDAYFYFD